MLNKNLVSCIVRDGNGNVDAVATKTKYETNLLAAAAARITALETKLSEETTKAIVCFDGELMQYIAERGDWDAKSHAAVMAVFEKHSKLRTPITKPTLCNMAAQFMYASHQIGVNDLKKAGDMVSGYISDNSGPIESGALFSVSKGNEGGVKLHNRHPDAVIKA